MRRTGSLIIMSLLTLFTLSPSIFTIFLPLAFNYKYFPLFLSFPFAPLPPLSPFPFPFLLSLPFPSPFPSSFIPLALSSFYSLHFPHLLLNSITIPITIIVPISIQLASSFPILLLPSAFPILLPSSFPILLPSSFPILLPSSFPILLPSSFSILLPSSFPILLLASQTRRRTYFFISKKEKKQNSGRTRNNNNEGDNIISEGILRSQTKERKCDNTHRPSRRPARFKIGT